MNNNAKKIPIIDIHQPGIYAIHNKRNDKYYIGSTNDLCNRTKTHRNNLYTGAVNSRMFQDLFSGRRQKDFEFIALEIFKNGEITEGYLRRREEYFIKKYKSDMNGYNNPDHRPAPHPTKGRNLVFGRPIDEKEKRSYDRLSITLPKGTRERIKATGETINGYITKLILQDLGRLEDGEKPIREDSGRSGDVDPF